MAAAARVKSGEAPIYSPEAVKEVIYSDRHCPKWARYTPGFDPQWHLLELWVQQLEEHREQFDRRMEQNRREWELKIEGRRRRFEVWLTFVLAFWAALAVAVGVAAILID